jgi:hypothetical protein
MTGVRGDQYRSITAFREDNLESEVQPTATSIGGRREHGSA